MPGWAFRPWELARLTDWQIVKLYADPFVKVVRRLLGKADPGPAVPLPDVLPDKWDDLVDGLMKAEGLTADEAEAKASRVHAALASLERAQAGQR